MTLAEIVGGGSGLVFLTSIITRWVTVRSTERRDALQQTLERLARVEGRADEQGRMLIAAQQQLAEERVKSGQRITQLEMRVGQLEDENAELRAENARLRQPKA